MPSSLLTLRCNQHFLWDGVSSIWSVWSDLISVTRVEFSQLAADYKTVNLGQGFPDFSPPKFVQDAFCKAICGGPAMHQYTRAFVRGHIIISSDVEPNSACFKSWLSPQGHPPLVKSLAKFFSRVVGHDIDPFEDVLVTVGAYQALFSAFQALIDDGDEVRLSTLWFGCHACCTNQHCPFIHPDWIHCFCFFRS